MDYEAERANEAAVKDGCASGAWGIDGGLLPARVERYLVLLVISASYQGLKAVVSQYGGTHFGDDKAFINTDADCFE